MLPQTPPHGSPQAGNKATLAAQPAAIGQEAPEDEALRARFLPALAQVYPEFHPERVRAFRVSRVREVFPLPILGYSRRLPPMTTAHRPSTDNRLSNGCGAGIEMNGTVILLCNDSRRTERGDCLNDLVGFVVPAMNFLLLMAVGLGIGHHTVGLFHSLQHFGGAMNDPNRLATPLHSHHLTGLQLGDIDLHRRAQPQGPVNLVAARVGHRRALVDLAQVLAFADQATLSARLDRLGATLKSDDDARVPFDDYYTTPEFSFLRLEMPSESWREGVALGD